MEPPLLGLIGVGLLISLCPVWMRCQGHLQNRRLPWTQGLGSTGYRDDRCLLPARPVPSSAALVAQLPQS